jgi:hypothetical protein
MYIQVDAETYAKLLTTFNRIKKQNVLSRLSDKKVL